MGQEPAITGELSVKVGFNCAKCFAKVAANDHFRRINAVAVKVSTFKR